MYRLYIAFFIFTSVDICIYSLISMYCSIQRPNSTRRVGLIQLDDALNDCYVGGAPRCHRLNEWNHRIDSNRIIELNRGIEYKL